MPHTFDLRRGRAKIPGMSSQLMLIAMALWCLFCVDCLAVPSTAAVEERMPANLPDPLILNDGSRVTTKEQWVLSRRSEILELLSREMYGDMPSRPSDLKFEVFEQDENALNGKATRKQIAVTFSNVSKRWRIDLLMYIPNAVKQPPVILGLNFWGNHAVIDDPAIRLTTSYIEEASPRNKYLDLSGVKNNRATEACRGTDAVRWPVEMMIDRGYAFATAYRGDIDPDIKDGFDQSLKSLYPDLQKRKSNFTTMGAWAWSLSRLMDYLETDKDIDPKRVALFGWSRLGKAALWAMGNDERFALFLDSEGGSGGIKLFHYPAGQTIQNLNNNFPHWYCMNFRSYEGQEATMPFDSHFAVALVAPRPIYSGASEGNQTFDPIGQFLAIKAAEPVYALLGKSGLPTEKTPALDTPVHGYLGYHRRSGRHDVTAFDWEQYLKFCDAHFGKRQE